MLRRVRVIGVVILGMLLGATTQVFAKGPSFSGSKKCGAVEPFWRRSTRQENREYCHLLIRGRATLATRPKRAFSLARKASRLQTANEEAELLSAQAELLFQPATRAHRRFQRTIKKFELTSLDLHVQLSAARAALLASDYATARLHYRSIVLRLDAVSSPREQARILIEAASATTYDQPGTGREARAYLNFARRKNAPLLVPVLEAAWVLSLQRDEKFDEAARIAERFDSGWEIHRLFDESAVSRGLRGEILPVLPPGEGFLLAAAIARAVDKDSIFHHVEEFKKRTQGLPSHLKEK